LIVGGWWFVPVSFMAFSWAGLEVGSRLTAWHVDAGSAPNALFFVLANIPEHTEPQAVRFTGLQDLQKEIPAVTFVLTTTEGEIRDDSASWRYQVKQQNQDKQEIEVAFMDKGGDNFSTSVYHVTRSAPASVTPLYARVMTPGTAVSLAVITMPCALIFAWLLHYLAMRAYRKMGAAQATAHSAECS
jgi:hypothetical protein